MGSSAYLNLGDYTLAAIRDLDNPTVMLLFTEDDKRVEMPEPGEVDFDPIDGEEADALPRLHYAASLDVVADRLEIMGYTLLKVREEFQSGIDDHIDTMQGVLNHFIKHGDANSDGYAAAIEKLKAELALLRAITFEDWLTAFTAIIRENRHPSFSYGQIDPREPIERQLVAYMLSESPLEGVWTPFLDFRSFVRAATDMIGNAVELQLDLSELLAAEAVDVSSNLCDWARRQTADEFVINHKVVILTEGKSDKRCIEGAIELLSPHLRDWYSFLDMEAVKAEGGAGALVSIVKAFVGAGIVNRVIAIFDNDSAARDALRGLESIVLPNNFRVVHLPDVDWAKSYPTLGPNGMAEMNVNGLAGSIELYFGSDVLVQPDGSPTPIQWTGYKPKVGQYQGEVINKGGLQDKFMQKLNACRCSPERIEEYDWSGMRAIIECIKRAFN